ncbi:MAG: DUF1684 domain-containing protein [Anaerolineae bacterium]|nr:DUF1684 domain-containing protein [Anaerolineae bacterium]MCI0611209.1 DUF1684 domain-containing protein [Anaerolineae bacterium]
MIDLNGFRKEKDSFFARHTQSPLTHVQKRTFHGLHYFPENQSLRLEVRVERFADQIEIEIPTSTGGVQRYRRYGRFNFEVDGQKAELTIYKAGHDYFLPFVDSLAGKETYPAGRYLEIESLGADRFIVDFNLAYNPYCAYNEQWSCPLTPHENHLHLLSNYSFM